MREVEIPGGTAMLRDREDMKMRHRRLIEIAAIQAQPAITKSREALARDEFGNLVLVDGVAVIDPEKANLVVYTAGEAQSMLEAQDATIVAVLASWSLDEDLPTLDTVGELPVGVYDALSAATKSAGADAIVGETDFTENPDRDRPTGSSTSSNGLSPETLSEPMSPLTPQSEHAGESISSESSTD